MKAILINQTGAPDVLTLTDVPKPEPKENEVLVKISAAALNYVDIWARKGSPAYPVKFPHILGADGAGVVEETGNGAEGVSAGERVLIFPGISDGSCAFCRRGLDNQCDHFEILGTKRAGTYAEYVCVPDQNVVAIPDQISFEQAAAFPLAYATAWHMVVGKAKVAAGENVLVLGASGGVGVAAMQIAKLKGAKVLAVTTNKHKVAKLKTLGADDVFVEERDSDFSKWALKNTDGRGVEVVIEQVGPLTWEKSLKSLARYGRLATCGATTGPAVTLDLRGMFSRDITIFGARLGTQREFQDLSTAVFNGGITPVVDRVFSLEEASSAHDYLEGKQQVGKILLKVG